MNPVMEALSLLTPYDIDKVKVRIGPPADGGYILVDDLSPDQSVVSYGISNEYSFEEEMAGRGHSVYMFDHTIEGIRNASSKMRFFREGVAGTTDTSLSLFTIDDHLARHEIKGNRLILKMDVEGAEFDAFSAIPDVCLARFEQITLEAHNLYCLQDFEYRARFCAMFRKINSQFTLFHVHANNFDGHGALSIVSGIPVSSLLELSYVRSSSVIRRTSQTLYPTALDYPNTGVKDKLLWFFPFLPSSSNLEDFAACEDRVEQAHRLRAQWRNGTPDSRPVVNLAIGKPATQSSMSPWSTPDEASRAVSGFVPASFAFHTGLEDWPWWQVDLLDSYPIEYILVHNRLDAFPERARTLRVEFSHDRLKWVPVHAGEEESFSGGEAGSPFGLFLGSRTSARYIRLSLCEKQSLHLSQVEVFVRAEVAEVARFKTRHGLASLSFKTGEQEGAASYAIEMDWIRDANLPVIGLKVDDPGRFGNSLQRCVNAIQVAQKTGLKYTLLGGFEPARSGGPVAFGDVTLLPGDSSLPPGGIFLSGSFADRTQFAPVLEAEAPEESRVVKEIIQANFINRTPQLAGDHLQEVVAAV